MERTLPADFVAQMQNLLGDAEADKLCQTLLESQPPVSLRLHPAKGKGLTMDATSVPWANLGRYLAERPTFTADPRFHAGCYYVQEAASMFIEQAFRAMDIVPRAMLDLCAAPGGKSTHWRSLIPDDCLLVANEPVPLRAAILAENLSKWGHPSTIVTQAYPDAFGQHADLFDIIAADVPCSGEGMFRKDDGAVNEWSLANVSLCADRQRTIIADVWQSLREEGFLVYSTCTFNAEECEDNVRFICEELGAEYIPLATEESWGAVTTDFGTHFYPHRAEGEGFFLALLRKRSGTVDTSRKGRKSKGGRLKRIVPQQVNNWIANPETFAFFSPDENLLAAIPEAHFDTLERLSRSVRIVRAGVLIAEAKGKKLIPQPELALSLALNLSQFPKVNLNLQDALTYLAREALTLDSDVPRGYVLACYENHPLGFLNNLGNRANNLYPAEWRIRNRNLLHL